VVQDDYPLTDSQSQLSSSTLAQLPHLPRAIHGVLPSRLLEDSATQTQLKEAFLTESKDAQVVSVINKKIDYFNCIGLAGIQL